MSILFVGDPHVTAAELKDCEALLGLVEKVVIENKPDAVVFLGDQHHNHGIVHLLVMDFWIRWVNRLAELTRVWLIIGNHDKLGDGRADVHSMLPHKGVHPNVTVIDRPTDFPTLLPGVLFVPHMDSQEAFLQACRAHHDKPLVVCHQTFNGGQYENGFYAKDGIEPSQVPQKHIWSGHIHAPQEFGKVWYMGAPRWRTSADANTDRYLWLMNHDDYITLKAKFATGDVCKRIISLDIGEDDEMHGGDPLTGLDPKKDSITLTLTGSGDWLKVQAPRVERLGYKVRTIKTGTQAAPRVRESEGIGTAFRKFTKSYQAKNGTPVEVLEKMATERLARV